MEIREHSVSFHLPLARDYVENFASVAELFDYNPYNDTSTEGRYQQLQAQHLRCNREQLIDVLRQYNERIGNTPQAFSQLERLADPRSVVVVGGQQPGIMTGPLYTVHKVITILTLAKQEEARLGVPVIPVFWIAGEDHDWDEVNHVYVATDSRIKKHTIGTRLTKKASISHIPFDSAEVRNYIDKFMDAGLRTEYTNSLRERLHHELQASSSYSDFFARLIVLLFGEEGIVLVDSADASLRSLEGEMFRAILQHNVSISDLLQEASNEVIRKGYTPQVESKHNHANLFIYKDGERVALDRAEDHYVIRNSNDQLTQQELIDLTYTSPSSFSCNVVTRPLMQEYLFPVLAFVGGPGEISYWALYRRIFEIFGMRMPLLVPRITMSLVERHVQRLAEEHQLSFADLNDNIDARREQWLSEQEHSNNEHLFVHVKQEIRSLYASLRQELQAIDAQLPALSDSNLSRILDEVAYLERKTRESVERKHEAVLSQYERAKQALTPTGKPQERIYNIFSYINLYGFSWWQSFKKLPFVVNGQHKEIQL